MAANLPPDFFSPENHQQINSPPKVWAPEARRDDGATPHGNITLNARAPVTDWDEDRWDYSLMSIPPGNVADDGYWDASNEKWMTTFDESRCEGQIIYVVEKDVIPTHQVSNRPLIPRNGLAPWRRRVDELTDVGQEFTENNGPSLEFLPEIVEFPERHNPAVRSADHGNAVASKLNGRTMGLCTKAQVIVVRHIAGALPDNNSYKYILERTLLVPLMTILRDVTAHPDRARRAIVNLSLGYSKTHSDTLPGALKDTIRYVLQLLDEKGVVVVLAANNDFQDPETQGLVNGVPERLADPNDRFHRRNLILASGIDKNSWISPFNPHRSWMAMAPGVDIWAASTVDNGYNLKHGSSFATPMVAATIAYWRGLPNMIFEQELKDPANVKALVAFMHRRLGERPGGQTFDVTQVRERRTEADEPDRLWRQRVPFLWNGDVPGGNCLVNPDLKGCPEQLKDRNIVLLEPFGADPGCGLASGAAAKRQTGGGACPLVFFPPPQRPQVGPGGSITFIPGAPSPTCTAGCGTLCTGYFCRPDPTGKPRDQWDPNDPRRPAEGETDPASTPPPLPDTGSCTAPQVATATTVCNGSGGQGACNVQTICAVPEPEPPKPTLPPVSCSPPEVVTTATHCIRGACVLTPVCVTSRPTPTPTSTSTPTPTPEPPKEFLAVMFTQLHQLNGRICSERAGFYSIKNYGEKHQDYTTYCNTSGDDTHVAGSNTDMGEGLFGDYMDGWSVSETAYGSNVHNGKGQHQRCAADDFTLELCTLSCGDYFERVLKCDGVWYDD